MAASCILTAYCMSSDPLRQVGSFGNEELGLSELQVVPRFAVFLGSGLVCFASSRRANMDSRRPQSTLAGVTFPRVQDVTILTFV